MAEYILKDEDYKLIDKLIEVTTSIETQYKKLYDLEINNNKDTKEYTELLNYLNNSIEAENKIYKDADLTRNKMIKNRFLITLSVTTQTSYFIDRVPSILYRLNYGQSLPYSF